jgi:hypothetical protein
MDAARVAVAAAQVGAFMFASNSGDSAHIFLPAAGIHTAQITGEKSTAGVALAEIYGVP